MPQFKVGDKVRVTRASGTPFENNSLHKVTYADESFIGVDGGLTPAWATDRFQRVDKAKRGQVTSKNVEIGDRVRIKGGQWWDDRNYAGTVGTVSEISHGSVACEDWVGHSRPKTWSNKFYIEFSNLEFVEEEVKTDPSPNVGDVFERDGEQYTVLGRADNMVFLSFPGDPKRAHIATSVFEMEDDGFKPYVPKVVLTKAQIARRFRVGVDRLVIED